MVDLLINLWCSFWRIMKSKYKWLLILFVIWMYRIDFMPADGSGFAKAIQVVTLFGMSLLLFFYNKKILRLSFHMTNMPVKTCLLLYIYAILSTLWAFNPMFAFFLSFQNFILILFFLWLFSESTNFCKIEKSFLLVVVAIMLFEAIGYRLLVINVLFIHYLPVASSAALCLSYCTGELLSKRLKNKKRNIFLKSCIVLSFMILATSTSAGANVSAVLGVACACILSGKILWSFLLFGCFGYLYFNPTVVDQVVNIIMAGKDKENIESVTGRDILWETMLHLASQKPIFGWGFGCIERAATATGVIETPDAHNTYVGIYGSLGILGCVLAGFNFISSLFSSFANRLKPGMTGVFCALACGLLNGYSYGFLSGKACSITVIYIALIVLTFSYKKVLSYEYFSANK